MGGAFRMHQPGGRVSWFARASPPGKSSPQRGAPERGGHPRPNHVALHLLVSCLGGRGAGGGSVHGPSSVQLRPAGPQPGLLGLRHVIRGTPRDATPAGGRGPQLQPRLPAAGTAVRPGDPLDPPPSGRGPSAGVRPRAAPSLLLPGPGGHTPLAHRWAPCRHAAGNNAPRGGTAAARGSPGPCPSTLRPSREGLVTKAGEVRLPQTCRAGSAGGA